MPLGIFYMPQTEAFDDSQSVILKTVKRLKTYKR